jgi:phosphoglycerate transporter family protein
MQPSPAPSPSPLSLPAAPHSNWLPRFLRPRVADHIITDPIEVERRYAAYRPQILLWSTIGYGMFYFVRKNLSIAMPVMLHQLHFTKSDMGLILTLHGLVYGLSKFLNGILADRANARLFMSLALIVSAIINVFFGLSSSLMAFGFLWMANGWFQGMGYPPCARLLTHWFPPKQLATKMSIWNASHSLGGGTIVVLCGFVLTLSHNNWRLCFFVPAGIALVTALLMLRYLRDTPASVGLPEVRGTGPANAPESDQRFKDFLWEKIFSNKFIWFASAGNFFVYTIRFAVFDWAPTLLQETKGVTLLHAGWMQFAFEVAGLGGMLSTGWLTDRWFRGRGAPLSLACMLLCGVSIFFFWKAPAHDLALNTVLLMCAGFFVYGPQALVAVIVAHLATKRAAATAIGLTSIFGYASTVLSGWGLGKLVETYGWPPVFRCLIVIAVLGAVCFALALPARAQDLEAAN